MFYVLHQNSSDNLSSSLVSSTSSWRQQISPLDVESDGIKLDTLGLRPKVDSLTVAAKDSSDDGGSGRSTPILHHHYHHHFHHPVGSDNVKKTGNSWCSWLYNLHKYVFCSSSICADTALMYSIFMFFLLFYR